VAEAAKELAARVISGDRRAVARAMTLADRDAPEAGAVHAALARHLGRAHLIGMTGAPGAGKSTLVNALVAEFRRRGRRVGVIAVDPSSPISGGAILGDRVRMDAGAADEGVFIRSLASRGHLGGLSRAAGRAADLLDAAGYDVVMIETVGAGQSEVEVADLAQTRLVVCPPGLGDDIQALKAGILEIADILVVNKADLPGAERAERDLASMLGLRAVAAWKVAVCMTSATTGAGVAALADTIGRHRAHLAQHASPGGPAHRRRLLASVVADRVRARIAGAEETALARALDLLAGRWRTGELDDTEAAAQAIALLGGEKRR
jgi:LAO/AO transport system kinase